ncbi:MAG: PilZ domain-containing protein [Candidatus Omnitrophica bacterium]|jgi:c-di-GMP-binding flagellar brake protein YcgR|nr:PilZ domain-containing protein [Candidatus Omnitrophota bacterium]
METRLTHRLDLRLKVTLGVDEEFKNKFVLADGNNFEAEALDISVSGIGIISKYYIPTGLIVILEIPGKIFGLKDNIKTKAEIRYCKFIKSCEYRCGIKFLDMSEEYKNAIVKFISIYEKRKEPRLKLSE